MKVFKYLFLFAALTGFSMVANAQTGTSADVDAVKQLVKNKPADYDKQLKAYTKANKKNAENLVAIGRALYENADYTNAAAFANAAFSAKKNFAPAFNLLGDIASVSEEDGGKAAGYYEQAILFDPKDPEAYRKYATVYRKVSIDDAVSKLEDLRTQRPDYPVDALIAHINYTCFRYNAAAEAYSRVAPNQLSMREYAEYAYSLFKNKSYEKALGVIENGLKKDDKNSTLNRLGLYCAVKKKQADEAMKFANTLFTKIDKDSVKLTHMDYENYGQAYAIDSLYDKAIEKYNEGLRINAENESEKANLYMGISDAYKGMKDYVNAIKYYDQYMAAVGEDEQVANDFANLGTLYMLNARTKDEGTEERTALYKRADEYFVTLMEKFPDTEEYSTYQRARVHAGLDPDMEQALAKPFFEKVIELIIAHEKIDNTDKTRLVSSYRYLLGYYNIMMKDKEKALFYAKKVQELAPSDNINALVELLSK